MLIVPDTTLTTDQKLKEIRIMSLQKQLEYNKGLFVYRVLSNDLYTHTHTLPHAIQTLETISLVCLGQR